VKVADADSLPVIFTTQVRLLPVQAPDHPEKLHPVAAAAVRVTWVGYAKLAVQIPGQDMPEGELVTLPLPLAETLNVYCFGVKVAIADSLPVIFTTQVGLLPEQAPDHPEKLYPVEGVAVRVA
jgi:hypothetical protein